MRQLEFQFVGDMISLGSHNIPHAIHALCTKYGFDLKHSPFLAHHTSPTENGLTRNVQVAIPCLFYNGQEIKDTLSSLIDCYSWPVNFSYFFVRTINEAQRRKWDIVVCSTHEYADFDVVQACLRTMGSSVYA